MFRLLAFRHFFHFSLKILAEFRYFTAKTSTKGQYLHFI